MHTLGGKEVSHMHTSRGCVVIRMQDVKALMVCALLLRFKNYKNVHVRHLDMDMSLKLNCLVNANYCPQN